MCMQQDPERAFRLVRTAAPAVLMAVVALAGCASTDRAREPATVGGGGEPSVGEASPDLIAEGKRIFRSETFGDEQLWTETLRLHEVVEQHVDPMTALKVGLKVDADVLPPGILDTVDLASPATTVALLRLNAIVGLQAVVDADGHITRLGVTCALCHSSVDDSVMPGIGHRRDGWPNRQLDVGAIIALSPTLSADQKKVYASWGPGKYDPRYNQDGKSTPLVIPPAYGLAEVSNETYTAEGAISYWNAYVAVTQMGGQGNFADPRLGIDVRHSPDLVTPRLAALRAYQHSLSPPAAPVGTFDEVRSARGRVVFDRACASCHVGGNGTDNNQGKLHAPEETGVDGAYAARTANRAYRTTPLRALWQHPPYFHDGSAATLADVVSHYDRVLSLALTAQEQGDLVEYLEAI